MDEPKIQYFIARGESLNVVREWERDVRAYWKRCSDAVAQYNPTGKWVGYQIERIGFEANPVPDAPELRPYPDDRRYLVPRQRTKAGKALAQVFWSVPRELWDRLGCTSVRTGSDGRIYSGIGLEHIGDTVVLSTRTGDVPLDAEPIPTSRYYLLKEQEEARRATAGEVDGE